MAGASLTAAKGLTTKQYKFAINWCGGWHHALRSDILVNKMHVTIFVIYVLYNCNLLFILKIEIQLKVFVI